MDGDHIWRWASNGGVIPASVTDWDTNGVFPGNEKCLMLNLSQGNRWRDQNCDTLQRYICEIKYDECRYQSKTPIS